MAGPGRRPGGRTSGGLSAGFGAFQASVEGNGAVSVYSGSRSALPQSADAASRLQNSKRGGGGIHGTAAFRSLIVRLTAGVLSHAAVLHPPPVCPCRRSQTNYPASGLEDARRCSPPPRRMSRGVKKMMYNRRKQDRNAKMLTVLSAHFNQIFR